ncbi:MAG: hypothetical protein ACREOA_09350, partial [Candidatus Dormibacteria bacterium]
PMVTVRAGTAHAYTLTKTAQAAREIRQGHGRARRRCPDRRALRTPRYRAGPGTKIRRTKYKSRIRGMVKTRPHQRPVAQSTTMMTAIQIASSSRITSDDFRC